MSALAGGPAVALSALLLWSAGAKTREALRGRAGALVAAVPGPRRLRPALLALTVAAELTTAAVLALAPATGFVLAGALLAVFAAASASLPDGRPCRCFGSALEYGATRTGRLLRTLLLALLAAGGWTLAQLSPAAPLAPQALAFGAMLVAVVVATGVLIDSATATTPARTP